MDPTGLDSGALQDCMSFIKRVLDDQVYIHLALSYDYLTLTLTLALTLASLDSAYWQPGT